jgi:uncharacterized damage-inducible protein DinB
VGMDTRTFTVPSYSASERVPGMPWTAPEVTRPAMPRVADERPMLEAWLDWHRQTLLMKCTRLGAEQLKRRSAPPSTLTLHGLGRHMAEVERDWCRICCAGQALSALSSTAMWPTADFDDLEAADPATDFVTFAEEVRLARAVTGGRALDDTFVHPQRGMAINLRWVYVHMIEEYARHNGHADLLRERIDGTTGARWGGG